MTPAAPAPVPAPRSKRKPALLIITALALLGGGAYWGWWHQSGQFIESTDNAYVQGSVVPVTARTPGVVKALMADDTQVVQAGQVLLSLDDRDAQLALDKAEAALAQAVREVQIQKVSQDPLRAQVTVREAEVQRARSQWQAAQDDAQRRADLARTGFVSQQANRSSELAVETAQHGVEAAQAALKAAREQLEAQTALVRGTTVGTHPNVLKAAADVRAAYLALHRHTVEAPLGGQIVRRTVQVGQRVEAGTSLMQVVPLDQVWVEANFKEPQLRKLHLGQPVELTADLYGPDVVFHGRIEGLAAGTGAAFALLPAQNATGNWIKVVQRVPVRIRLDPQELQAHPLRVGLSMKAEVDLHEDHAASSKPLLAGISAQTPSVAANLEQDEAVTRAALQRVQTLIDGQVQAMAATGSSSVRLARVAP